jgi:hypothetical protein
VKVLNLKTSFLKAGAGLFFLLAPVLSVQADQEIYLSVSPNNHYRVVVRQEIMRRVDDQVFFRYPIEVVDTRTGAHFKIQSGSAPFIHETDNGTFQVDWSLVRFDWDKESRQFFFQLQVIEGLWHTYYVNIPRQRVLDITPILEAGLLDQFAKDQPSCGTPDTVFAGWMKPTMAVFELSSICGKDKPIPNKKFSQLTYTVLFDTKKEAVVSDCQNCADKKSAKKFDHYWLSTQVTPTPTPDETPGAE